MKLTVDTRYDTLESALATIRQAFGADQEQAEGTQSEVVPARPPIKPAGSTRGAKKATGKTTAARSAATRGAGRQQPSRKKIGATRLTAKRPAARRATSANVAPPGEADAIRAWARSQGMAVKSAGRLPASVIAAYEAVRGNRVDPSS